MFNLFSPNIKKLADEGNFDKIIELLDSKKSKTREEAFRFLFKNKGSDENILSKLRTMINDKDPGVRTTVILSFAEKGEPDAFSKIKSIIVEGSQKEKIHALKIISSIESIHQNEEIINNVLLAFNDKNDLIKSKVIKTMGYVKHHHFIPSLEESLHDKNPKIRLEAAKALGRIGGESAVDLLISALMDNDKDVEKTARNFLQKIGTPAAIKALNDKPFLQLLKRMNGPTKTRVETIQDIAVNQKSEGIPLLIKACSDNYKEVRIEALKAVRAFNNLPSNASIIKLLEDKFFDVRLEAIKTLTEIGTGDAWKAIEKVLNDPNSSVKEEAHRALELLKDRGV